MDDLNGAINELATRVKNLTGGSHQQSSSQSKFKLPSLLNRKMLIYIILPISILTLLLVLRPPIIIKKREDNVQVINPTKCLVVTIVLSCILCGVYFVYDKRRQSQPVF